jgi:hypothetical protein
MKLSLKPDAIAPDQASLVTQLFFVFLASALRHFIARKTFPHGYKLFFMAFRKNISKIQRPAGNFFRMSLSETMTLLIAIKLS